MKIRKFAMMLSLSAVLGLIACGSDDANPASDGGVSGSAMVDSRDGQSYRIVKIGKQTWMAQNLNYAAPNSVCYDNNPDFCAMYGRLYFYESGPTACPSGWHIPKRGEWSELFSATGVTPGKVMYSEMEKLLSKEGWMLYEGPFSTHDRNGSDDYGFSVLPAGTANTSGTFASAGTDAEFWAYEYKDWGFGIDGYWYRIHFSREDPSLSAVYENYLSKDDEIIHDARSIRCVKD
jgi:uncharacterized protein (TIGR02145 family)